MTNKANLCSVSFIGGFTLLSRVFADTRLSQRQPCSFFHILLFVIANISQVYGIKFIKCLRDYDITKQVYVPGSVSFIAGCTLFSRVV